MKQEKKRKTSKPAFNRTDIDSVVERYAERYNEFGYSPKTLGWIKGKQDLRFDSLTSQYNYENKHVLDIGYGFGDLNKKLSKKVSAYEYTGVELVDAFCTEAKK
jgi:ubiquinone/menaquinone biosynthesis C-methylase UbiE